MFLTKAQKDQRDKAIAYRKCFGSQEGKSVLYDLMNKFHVLNSHQGDPFMEGQRAVVLEILHQCSVDLEKFNEILKGEDE